MKIDRFTGTNWLKHARVDLEFAPLSLICGPNGAGKSSIADGVAFGMMNEMRRIEAKGDRDKLLTEGQEAGEVSLTCGGVQITRDIKSGKLTVAGTLPLDPDGVKGAVGYLLEPKLFAKATADQRRGLLFALLRLTLDDAALKAELIKRGHAEANVSKLDGPSAGWEKFAGTQATESRGAWKQITAETYGAVKAETWKAAVPGATGDLSTIPVLRAEVSTLQERIGSLQREAGASDANERTANQYRAQIDAQRPIAGALAYAQSQEAALRASVQVAQAAYDIAARSHTHQGTTGVPMECPCCLRPLVLADGKLSLNEGTPKPPTAGSADLAKLKADLDLATTKARFAVQDVAAANGAANLIAQLEESLAAIQPPAPVSAGIADDLQEARDDLATAQKNLADLELAEKATLAAQHKTESAAAAHAAVKAWTALSDATAPSGIAAEMLATGLEPFHATLRTVAETTGWAPITINAGMGIKAGGRPYGLLSESEQWRADAALAVAIAIHSRVKFVLLDRWDVLDVAGRGQALRWLHKLTQIGDLDSALVFGTLKEKPTKLPPEVAVHWLGKEAA